MKKSVRFLLHAFVLLTVTVAFADKRPCEWTNVTRIVAVGDVHGDCGQLVKCLRNAGVITASNTWAGGKTHLVQTGDILDRGPSSKQAMDLLMALEPQAERAGGMVHPLLGNHEAMVLAGDYSYLDPHEADAYGGLDEFKKSMAAEGKYGQWIRGHQAIIRINDILFVHGGITGTQTNRSLAEINARAAAALGPRDVTEAGDSLEVLWCRDLALAPKADLESVLAPVFRKYDVRHVVIGHTVVKNPPRIKSRLQGAVILIDVGMSRTYRGGPAICLLIENGTFSAVSDEGKTEIETETPE
jgi:hypothetical protein